MSFVKELHEERKVLDCQNDQIVSSIVEIATKNIKLLNSSGITGFLYEVPLFLLGFPVYDITSTSKKINKSLRKLGLKTLFVEPNKIYISWKKI